MELNVENISLHLDLKHPIKCIFVSDIHFDGYWEKGGRKIHKCPPELLNQIKLYVDYHNPEILFIGGDLMDDCNSNPYPFFSWLNDLKADHIYMVLGNHDLDNNGYKACTEDILLASNVYFGFNSHVRILRDEEVKLDNYGLRVIGIDDYTTGSFPCLCLDYPDDTTPTIVLSHNPDTYELIQEGIDKNHRLFLFGHTHGHQSNFIGKAQFISLLKFLNKFKLFRKFFHSDSQIQRWIKCTKYDKYVSGLYEEYYHHVYVSQGIGTHPPGRYNCPPTLTVFEFD